MALFGILSMDGHFQDNLKAAGTEIRARVTGRHRRSQSAGPVRDTGSETRIRALQEEVRVMQRLMDKERVERETQAAEMRKAQDEIVALRAAVSERDERMVSLDAALRDETAKTGKLREELAERSALLARSQQDNKDLETELSVAQSGAGLSAVSDEIARLRAERDALMARLRRVTKPVAVGK